MTTQTEALRLAISRLEWFIDAYPHDITTSKEDFLRPFKEALAQPEQEPVAWLYKSEPSFDGNKWHDTFEVTTSKQVALWKDKDAKPLYTIPPQRKPLTDEEIGAILEGVNAYGTRLYTFARAIEAAHGIKE